MWIFFLILGLTALSIYIALLNQNRQAEKKLRKEETAYSEMEQTDNDMQSPKKRIIDNNLEEDTLVFCIESDPLDGIDVNFYIDHIVKILVYSEHGYGGSDAIAGIDLNEKDFLFDEAARLIVTHQSGSTSLMQRKFSIGYNRAGRLMDQLEAAGIVGPAQGSKPRDVLIMDEYSLESKLSALGSQIIEGKIIDIVEEQYYVEIQERKNEYIYKLEQDIRIDQEQKLEDEKQIIREKILEKERKKQLEKEVRQEMIDQGLISPDN